MAQPNVYWAGTPNYTSGNYGIVALFPHWTEGGFEGSVSTLQNPSRQASAHYVIEGGRVAQLVREEDSAWHCGNHYYNMRAISYELVGWTGNPPSYDTLDTCARMMADASRRYFGGAKLVLGENVMLHKWVSSTNCPGETDIDWLVSKANEYLGTGNGGDMYPVSIPPAGAEVHRMYNPNSGEHFFTIDDGERDNLKAHGWVHEGTAWRCPEAQDAVYRMRNPNNGLHHFTANFNEAENLESLGWVCEGIPFFAKREGQPVHRMYNPYNGLHHLTVSDAERDNLANVGWKHEGVAWCV